MNTHVDGTEYELEHGQGVEEIWGTKEQGVSTGRRYLRCFATN